MQSKIIPFSLFILLILSSCKKEEIHAVHGSTEVDIIVTNPMIGAILSGTSELSVEARIESNDLMSGWQITISDASTGFTYEAYQDLYEQTMYTVHHHWIPSNIQSEALDIKIEALDQYMNALESKTVRVEYKP